MKSNRPKSLAISAIIVLGLILVQSCSKTPAPAFTIEPSVNPEAGDSISFLNTSVNATTYEWNFGDGNASTDMDPTNIYAASGSYEVTLTASNAKKSEMLTQTIIINDPTVLVVQTLEDDEETPVANVEVWVYDSEDNYNNNYFEPQFSAYTDEEGIASFFNLEAQVYIVDVFLETDTGSWSGYYPNLDALTLNELNGWGLIMDFIPLDSKKSMERKLSLGEASSTTRRIEK